MSCRICGASSQVLLDLGSTPPANRLKQSVSDPDVEYPLVLEHCDRCQNLQLRDCLDERMLYSHYLYMTPESSSLQSHYEQLKAHLKKNEFLSENSDVLEIGSNRGALLEFLKPSVRSVRGVDPAENIAAIANGRGIPTLARFFGEELVNEIGDQLQSDLILMRHAFAHNKDPHSILRGVRRILRKDGVFVIENNYAIKMLSNIEFDQIYHEHMFYYTLASLKHLLAMHELEMVDVFMSPVHGGSFVASIAHRNSRHSLRESVSRELALETPYLTQKSFERFSGGAFNIRQDLRELIARLAHDRKRVMAYGATAKGATLLNYCGLTHADIEAVADSTPTKQGRFIPRANLKVISEAEAFANPPDYFLLTAWNYGEELMSKTRAAGVLRTEFIVPIPEVRVLK